MIQFTKFWRRHEGKAEILAGELVFCVDARSTVGVVSHKPLIAATHMLESNADSAVKAERLHNNRTGEPIDVLKRGAQAHEFVHE
ncbi:MAG: hypothetical protein AMS22_04155 [Thiotrichales bacterium SG8_50]|nr:MAG: hypothetical protein AMS22_04155 [Thiotrichales bacterium SG8_50]